MKQMETISSPSDPILILKLLAAGTGALPLIPARDLRAQQRSEVRSAIDNMPHTIELSG